MCEEMEMWKILAYSEMSSIEYDCNIGFIRANCRNGRQRVVIKGLVMARGVLSW